MKRTIALTKKSAAADAHRSVGRPSKKIRVQPSPGLPAVVEAAVPVLFDVPEYTVQEFANLRTELGTVIAGMARNIDEPFGPTSMIAWIDHNQHSYSIHAYSGGTTTDTESGGREQPQVGSIYFELHEYSPSSNTPPVVAKVRFSFNGRHELMMVNAGEYTQGLASLKLIRDLVEPTMGPAGYTLHDEAKCSNGRDVFPIRKLRALAGVAEPSIYQRAGFRLVSLYQTQAGKYGAHTQIPAIEALAKDYVTSRPLDWMVETFIPVVKASYFPPAFQTEVDVAARRWCPDLSSATVQTLFDALLTASIHFKATDQPKWVHGRAISKIDFYKDLDLLLNCFMLDVHPKYDIRAIREKSRSIEGVPPAAIRDCFLVQCAISCIGSHMIFEMPLRWDAYTPLSQPINHDLLRGISDFETAIRQLHGGDPLSWQEFSDSSRVKALFEPSPPVSTASGLILKIKIPKRGGC